MSNEISIKEPLSLKTNNNDNSKYEKNCYISGIYHPPALRKEDIHPDDVSDVLNVEQLEHISKTMIGKPLTLGHPFDKDGNPVLQENHKSLQRGEIVGSRILPDGSAFFTAKIPITRNLKTRMFFKNLKNGLYKEASMGHVFIRNLDTGEDQYHANHIAIVDPPDRARRPGCNLNSKFLKIPKKRVMLNIDKGELKNFLNQLKKKRFEKKIHFASAMSEEQQSQRKLTDDALDQNDHDELDGIQPEDFKLLIAKAAANEKKYQQELAKLQQENESYRKKQEEEENIAAQRSEEQLKNILQGLISLDYDPENPITEDVKGQNAAKMDELVNQVLGKYKTPAERRAVAEDHANFLQQISVASEPGRRTAEKNAAALRERNNASRKRHHPETSSFSSRFLPGIPSSSSSSAPSSSSSSHHEESLDSILKKGGGGLKDYLNSLRGSEPVARSSGSLWNTNTSVSKKSESTDQSASKKSRF